LPLDAVQWQVTTAKLNDIDPQAWVDDLLARTADTPPTNLGELLPWNRSASDHPVERAAG
jgi:hypothetical protein